MIEKILLTVATLGIMGVPLMLGGALRMIVG